MWICWFAIKLNTKQEFKYFLRNHLDYTGTTRTALESYIAIGQIDGSVYVPGKTPKEHWCSSLPINMEAH